MNTYRIGFTSEGKRSITIRAFKVIMFPGGELRLNDNKGDAIFVASSGTWSYVRRIRTAPVTK